MLKSKLCLKLHVKAYFIDGILVEKLVYWQLFWNLIVKIRR